ncbi:MAG TPA: hypothetical protein VNO55_04540 [Polyangia bacterium]|nr:hypothetical protein [Polyangia bacterium]
MDIDDKELFSSAMADDPTPDVAEQPAEAPAPETPQTEERARDEHGRFAARQPDPVEQQPAPETAKDDAHVPSWRLREVREEAERRVAETEARWQRQFEMLQRQNQPKPEPTPAPDLFESPTGFVDHYLKQGLTPVEQRIQAMEARDQARTEFYSRREAEREHGAEAVRAAYVWLAENVKAQSPEVMPIYYNAMQSQHPFDAIVQAHKELSLVQQIKAAGGPDKWREQVLAAQSQPTGQRSNSPQGSIVKLPPSMSRLPASQVAGDDDPTDMSDAALFRHAMR